MPPKRKCHPGCPGDETCEHASVCMCGDYADHSPYAGHQPVSMHDYYCDPCDDQDWEAKHTANMGEFGKVTK